MIPGKKIREMIEKWGQQEVTHPEELEHYSQELWLSRAQFEEQLKRGTKGTDLIIER